jgi:light-regulated signal transduction histidine kinase (bacteriophytochrome)
LKGREFYAALTVAMRKDEAGEVYFDGVIEDISARKENERQIQRLNDSLRARSKELETINHELEAFSYSVSHDLRAPLRAMDGFSRALLDEYADRLDDKGRDRLHRIRAAAQRMAELIDDLLNLSRVSRTELKWEVVSLTQIANKVLDTLRQEAPERAMQCLVQPDLFAHGDTKLLRIMMDNLLGNAWKFTAHRQEAFIEVGCKVNEERVIYFVRDNGAGFDMTYADKLFGVFQRLHDANEFPGTGIGLATVQRVIHKHGGHVWAESTINQGATFYFTLEERK